jgi:hypothetical protein
MTDITSILQQEAIPLSICPWYAANSCCDQKDLEKITFWLNHQIAAAFYNADNSTGYTCYEYFQMWKCGYLCSPQQSNFVSRTLDESQSPPRIRFQFAVCSNFCRDFFNACKGANLMGFPLEVIYIRYQDFCLAQSDERIQVVLQEKNCFNGQQM